MAGGHSGHVQAGGLAAVVGPMHTTTGGSEPSPPAASTKLWTDDAEAKHTASAPAIAACSASVNDRRAVR